MHYEKPQKLKKPVCEICGRGVPEIGAFVQCSILGGHACQRCHVHCLHYRSAGSTTWCSAAYRDEKN